ncbi:MAG: carboxypeptidase-like regulatory domain-containing protein [bacterium]
MFHYITKIILILIILSMAIACRNPFGPNEGILSGVVTDNNGNVVVNAKVSVERIHTSSGNSSWSSTPVSETITNRQGEFILYDVPIDLVKIKVSKIGLTDVIKIEEVNQSNYWSCEKPSVEVELNMDGAPTLTSASVVPKTASISACDLIEVSAFVTDNYSANTYNSPRVQAILRSQDKEEILQAFSLTTNNSGPSGFFSASFDASDLSVGNFILEFSAVDADGNKSNILTATLTIIP